MQFISGLIGIDAIVLYVFLALVLAIVLFFAFVALGQIARRPEAPRRRIEVLERLHISGSRQAALLRFDNSEYLLLTGGPADMIVAASEPLRTQEEAEHTQMPPPPARYPGAARGPAIERLPRLRAAVARSSLTARSTLNR